MCHFPAPIIDRKIRFALVGCSRIAKNHLASLKQHADRAELVRLPVFPEFFGAAQVIERVDVDQRLIDDDGARPRAEDRSLAREHLGAKGVGGAVADHGAAERLAVHRRGQPGTGGRGDAVFNGELLGRMKAGLDFRDREGGIGILQRVHGRGDHRRAAQGAARLEQDDDLRLVAGGGERFQGVRHGVGDVCRVACERRVPAQRLGAGALGFF